jgi:hypothetical protein
MKRIAIALTALAAGTASSGTVPQRTAWFLRTIDGKQWCAFTSQARAKQAAASERFDDAAWVDYRPNGIVRIVVATESEDSYVADSYSLNTQGRATRVIREGHYIENPVFSVTYVPGKSAKLELIPASRTVVRAQEKAKHETYFLGWPLYTGLASMPFRGLIQTKTTVAVTERCINAPR